MLRDARWQLVSLTTQAFHCSDAEAGRILKLQGAQETVLAGVSSRPFIRTARVKVCKNTTRIQISTHGSQGRLSCQHILHLTILENAND